MTKPPAFTYYKYINFGGAFMDENLNRINNPYISNNMPEMNQINPMGQFNPMCCPICPLMYMMIMMGMNPNQYMMDDKSLYFNPYLAE